MLDAAQMITELVEAFFAHMTVAVDPFDSVVERGAASSRHGRNWAFWPWTINRRALRT